MTNMLVTIREEVKECLPVTYRILQEANLTVHPYVYQIVLTGSRGLAGGFRGDSDIDLSLLVERDSLKKHESEEAILKEIFDITLSNWKSNVELDTAIVFDINDCSLKCFESENICKDQGIDCMGLYKLQKGFNGYVPKIGIDIKRIYPMLTIWSK